MGIGGYALFVLVSMAEVSPLLAVPLSGVAAATVALPAARLLFRLHGPHFAIGSWVLAEALRLLCTLSPALGGGSGMSLPLDAVRTIAPDQAGRQAVFYLLALGLALAATAFAWACCEAGKGLR